MRKSTYYLHMLSRIRLAAIPKLCNYARYRAVPRRPVVSGYLPQIGGLLLTKRCNLQCSFCNTGNFLHSGTVSRAEANLERVRQIMAHRLFASCLLVDLLGGEPLLVSDLDRIVAYLDSRGHLTNMSTNGILLRERIADLKDAGITRINVSVYENTMPILERDLCEVNHVFPVHASIILFKSELESHPERIIERARFTRDAGCRSLRFWVYRPIGRSPDFSETFRMDDPSYLDFRRRVEAELPGYCLWPAGGGKRCVQLWQRIGSDMDGNLAICCGIDSLCGSLFDSGDMLNRPLLVEMRTKLLDPASEPPEACRTCPFLGEPGW